MARRGGQPIAEHHQQARRHEEFAALRFGDKMEEGPQREATENDQRGQPQRRRNERAEKLPSPGRARLAADNAPIMTRSGATARS